MKFKAYTVNYQHRGKLPLHQKSQWVVSEWEELRLFTLANINNWQCKKQNLWSVHEQFNVLGRDQKGDLHIAKYWANQDVWHGYPVSSKRSGDRPPSLKIRET
ncbi:MAG: hypothetical protein KAG45_02210, partial [Methyloprofundus sp.]|nr:hypothetical protein [Methyloprofundus sp.]